MAVTRDRRANQVQKKLRLKDVSYESRLSWLAFLTGLPGAIVSFSLLLTGDFSTRVQWTLGVLIVIFWWGFAHALRGRVILPMQTLSNLLAALREGDYSDEQSIHRSLHDLHGSASQESHRALRGSHVS